MFYFSLKNSLVNYVNDVENDYKFAANTICA